MDEDAPALSHTVIEAQRRHALKLRLRKECLAFNIDVEHLFDTPERSQTAKDLVPPEVFYKTLALHGIRFNDDDKTLLLHFASPSGLLSLQSFLHFLDLQRPSDHVDPDLTFALLPQPFRMLNKILDDDILDRAWSAITSSMTYKLQQGQLNADLQEKEAKALLCPPSSAVVIAVTIPSLDWPIRVSGDRDLIGVLHDNSTLELLQANGEQTMPPTTPLFSSSRLQVQCLSEFKPMRLGQVKRTFFAIGARKLPKPSPPPPVEGAPVQAVVDVPDPVADSLESLVHVYATNSTATSLRYTFSTMDRVVGLTLADDVLFLAVHFESGAVDVYRTPNLASDLASESVAALDASSLVLHVDPSSYRIQAPNKGVASDAAATAAAVTATPAATKGDKHKDKGKGNKDLVVEDVALAIAPPAVYSAYLFVAFLMDLSPQPSTTPTTTGIVLASQYKMLQFQLSPAPPSMCASTTVILSSNVMCAALDASATLVVLGLESGSVIAWNTRLHVELSGLCPSTIVIALSMLP
ncbi:hypothetical protein AaE_004648 [Aphanomyces astaci]|uniref:Uncharacterized protein n=1 Tax=Aphanomyces astaci TaxID=112090 RepID=A0A6A5ARI4_APHAT|nr:hypothetical protein AaE_004648 [Aphanomyces astaci]